MCLSSSPLHLARLCTLVSAKSDLQNPHTAIATRFTSGAPGFDSWSYCTYTETDDYYGQCDGCSVEKQAGTFYVGLLANGSAALPAFFPAETFPVFPAILNAVHQRGVSVKILTNNYNTPTCRGNIAPLDYLALNGVEIVYYASTTFMHAKYLHVNGNKTSVSSVNFSWTSFNKNREAGIIVSGEDAMPLMNMMHSVFLDDLAAGIPYTVNQTYSASDMAIITSKNSYPVVIPAPQQFPGNYVTPQPKPIAGTSTVTAFTSPDDALKTLLADVTSATKSFQLHMYQITDPTLCTLMEKLHTSDLQTPLKVFSQLLLEKDSAAAHTCYNQLLQAGMQVRLTPSYYTYSHQKYWIVDGERMGLSTGNWSPTDYPPVLTVDGSYPPFGDADWQRVNRDFNLLVKGNADFLSIFSNTFEQDYVRGSWYSSSNPL